MYLWPGIIIPVRFAISIALLFISVKCNVVAFYEGNDFRMLLGHSILLANAIVNVACASLSIMMAWIRDEEKLPPRLRWNSAAFGLFVRLLLFGLATFTVVVTAISSTTGAFRVKELIPAEITLGLLLYVGPIYMVVANIQLFSII